MTVSVDKMLTDFGVLANDPDSVTWTAAERLSWLNEGQVELVKTHVDAKVKTTNFSLVAGARQTNPNDCIEIVELRQNVSGNAITTCDRSALDKFTPGWMIETQSAAIKHYMDDPQPDTFYVYPPAIAGTQVVMTYNAVPSTVASGQNIDVRDIYSANLLNYMLYRAFSKDADSEYAARATAYYQLFKE